MKKLIGEYFEQVYDEVYESLDSPKWSIALMMILMLPVWVTITPLGLAFVISVYAHNEAKAGTFIDFRDGWTQIAAATLAYIGAETVSTFFPRRIQLDQEWDY